MQNDSLEKSKKISEVFVRLFDEFSLFLSEEMKDLSINIDVKGEEKSAKVVAFFKKALENEHFSLFKGELTEVLYAMAALVDELFLNTKWEGKEYWSEHIIEEQFFGSEFAGEMIYRKIDKIISENERKNLGIAEIYLKLLSLGFQGKFRDDPYYEERINAYRKDLFTFLIKYDAGLADVGLKIFQKEYAYTIPTIHRKLLPDASIVNKLALAFILVFFIISSVVWIFETQDLRKSMRNIAEIALIR